MKLTAFIAKPCSTCREPRDTLYSRYCKACRRLLARQFRAKQKKELAALRAMKAMVDNAQRMTVPRLFVRPRRDHEESGSGEERAAPAASAQMTKDRWTE